MSRYKDADELLKRLNSCKYSAEKTTIRQVTYNAAISDACRSVDAIPTADVAEVNRGRWKPFDLTYGRSIYFCTACNDAVEMPTFNGKPMYKWCPNCGARMVEE